METTTHRHEDAANVEEAIRIALEPAVAKREQNSVEGMAARLSLAILPNFIRMLDDMRRDAFNSGQKIDGGDAARVNEETLNNILQAVNTVMTNMLSMVATNFITCATEPNQTCPGCAAEREHLIDHLTAVLNRSTKGMQREMHQLGTVRLTS